MKVLNKFVLITMIVGAFVDSQCMEGKHEIIGIDRGKIIAISILQSIKPFIGDECEGYINHVNSINLLNLSAFEEKELQLVKFTEKMAELSVKEADELEKILRSENIKNNKDDKASRLSIILKMALLLLK